MPVSLDGLEVTFKQLHHECIKHAKRREALLSQVQEQEHHLEQLRQAVQEERSAINLERRILNEEKEAFHAFRNQMVRELREQQHKQQIEYEMRQLEHSLCSHAASPTKHPASDCCAERHHPGHLKALRDEQEHLVQTIQQQLQQFVQYSLPEHSLSPHDF